MILIKIINFINIEKDTIISFGGKKYRLLNRIPIQYEEYYSYGGMDYGTSQSKDFFSCS